MEIIGRFDKITLPIKQKDPFGCGVACIASILNIDYQNSLSLFENGEVKAKSTGFLCSEIVTALSKAGLRYKYEYLGKGTKNSIYKPNAIVFLRRSKKYPAGHYLCRKKDKWMDPWINFPEENRKTGFRKRLPGKPIYVIYPI